ncbi:hypothetical protein Tc00.1047053506979.30 [Trypanosoma cruzi]|uniref:Uncharacterized protein n=1 Tax=Trypanosoma cruzi (strain CL Brener) TaxID=353153 RepID=Q4CWL3_TRYCC|nr:hypothetical protein Tc00.1047053506979.30 [Trypanosoma cruzi]EAN84664.1 hypothetical protein Tc00.1047053506979.30 [Trypanosoma cruzi]|eukprot:XP_806515.1 hypothetical protein [Trypanosoma cruzi strain CL Brener]
MELKPLCPPFVMRLLSFHPHCGERWKERAGRGSSHVCREVAGVGGRERERGVWTEASVRMTAAPFTIGNLFLSKRRGEYNNNNINNNNKGEVMLVVRERRGNKIHIAVCAASVANRWILVMCVHAVSFFFFFFFFA